MMFPVRINVLSDSKKSHLKRLTLFTYLKSSFAIVFALVAILATLLIITQNYFITYETALTYGSLSLHPSFRADIKHITETNTQLKKINSVQKDFTLWSPRLEAIMTAIPNGITIDSLTFDRSDNTFTLVGTADTRDTLDECEKRLKNLPSLESVEIPVGELTRREFIPFTAHAILK